MRINLDQKSLDMEQRDMNFILPRYIATYLFQSKNEDPVEIVFPMFSSVPHPVKPGVQVPIRWVPEISPEAMEISVDGAGVAEATEEEIAAKDEQEDMMKEAKAEIESLSLEPPKEDIPPATPAPEDLIRQHQETAEQLQDEVADLQLEVDTSSEEVSPARAAFAEVVKEEQQAPTTDVSSIPPGRIPKKPEHEAPEGSTLSDISRRDPRDQKQVKKDLLEEPDVEEDKEIEVDIRKPEEQQNVEV